MSRPQRTRGLGLDRLLKTIATPMKQLDKSTRWLLMGLAVAFLTAVAQDIIGPKPPLSAVGRDAPWTAFDDDYRLNVSPEYDNRPVQLELYSPDINLDDYLNQRDKSAAFYGDEIYGKANRNRVSTTFTLSNTDGSNLAQKTYKTSNQHRLDTLFLGVLPTGAYPLQALTDGPGKNGFGFRVSQGAVMEASQFTQAMRNQFNKDQVLARLTLPKEAIGQVLKIENYDADGPKEAQLFLVQPGSRRSALKVSGNTEWASNSYTVGKQDIGEWTVLVRLLPTTKQFSNSIGLRFKLGDKPFYVKVPQEPGKAPEAVVNVKPVAQVCDVVVPLKDVGYGYSGKTAKAPGKLYLLPGSYTLQGEALGGYISEPLNLNLSNGQTVDAELSYPVTPSVSIEPDSLELGVGESTTATIRVSTDFPQAIPYKLALSAPDGVSVEGDSTAAGTVSADQPAEFQVQLRGDKAAAGELKATLEPDCAQATASVKVVAPEPEPAALEIVKTVQPTEAAPGDTVKYSVTVSNPGGSEAKAVHLMDLLADGLQGNPLDETFDLAAGESKTFEYTATVGPDAADSINNTAAATTEDGLGAVAVAELKINRPVPAALVLTRTALVPNPALPGEQTKVCLQVKNTGGTAASYNLNDNPTDLLEPAEAPSFEAQLEPNQTAEHCYNASVTEGDPAKAELSATLISDGLPNQIATTPFERVNLLLEKTTPTPVVRPGREAKFQITVTSPLNRIVTAQLKGDTALKLSPDENRTLTLNPGANAFEVNATPQQEGDYPNTINVTINDVPAGKPATSKITVKALPQASRETEVTVAARLGQSPSAGTVILSDVLPGNAEYILGSSKLLRAQVAAQSLDPTVINRPNRNAGEPIADPLISGNRLYWVIPGQLADTYVVSYLLKHTDPIQLPDNRLGVLLQVPQTKSAGKPRTPEGQPVLGSLGDLRLISGVQQVLEDFLKARPIGETNQATLSLGATDSTVAQLAVYPTRPLTTDKADQPELTILARDADGRPSTIPFVTVDISPEPATPDAAPNLPGYQVKMTNGQGVLRLTNLGQTGNGLFTPGTPDTVKIQLSAGGVVKQASFAVEDTERPMIIVGSAGVQLNLVNFNSFSIGASLNAFARGDLSNGMLFTGAINTGADWSIANGFVGRAIDLLPPANPFERFPLTGDGQIQGADAVSSDCCYFRIDAGRNYLQYGQMNTGFTGLLTGYSAGYNGLKGVLRSDNLDVNGFVALVPNANLGPFVIAADGSSVYRLANQDIVEASDLVAVVVRNRDNARLQTRINLIRNVDYRIDYTAGVLELMTPLLRYDQNGDTQELEVRYATVGTQLEARGGVQARFGSDQFGVKATYLRFDAAQPSLLAAGIYFENGPLDGELELASNTAQLSLLGIGARLGFDSENLDFRIRYQDLPSGYIDPRQNGATSAPGKDLQAGVTWRAGNNFSLSGRYNLSQDYSDPAGHTNNQFSLEGRLGAPGALSLLLGGGAGFDLTPAITNNFSTRAAYLSAGLELPISNLTLTVRQLIGLGATPGATDIGLDYAITRNFGIRFQSRISYTANGYYNVGALGVRGSFANTDLLRTLLGNSSLTPDTDASDLGSTNIAASYELPNLSGDAGRSRVGLDTTIPLGNNFSLNLGSNLTIADKGQGGASGNFGIRYTGDKALLSANLELSGQAIQPGIKTVFGIRNAFKLSDTFIFSTNGEYVREATGDTGARFSVAAALRANQLSILTNNIYRIGFYRASDGVVLEGEVRAGYQANERLYFRIGGAYRVLEGTGTNFVGQVGGGLTYFLTDTFGLGLNGSYMFDNGGFAQSALGVEGSFRISSGWLLSAGLNFFGTSTPGIGSFQSQPGLYLRLDWKFDENTFGIRW